MKGGDESTLGCWRHNSPPECYHVCVGSSGCCPASVTLAPEAPAPERARKAQPGPTRAEAGSPSPWGGVTAVVGRGRARSPSDPPRVEVSLLSSQLCLALPPPLNVCSDATTALYSHPLSLHKHSFGISRLQMNWLLCIYYYHLLQHLSPGPAVNETLESHFIKRLPHLDYRVRELVLALACVWRSFDTGVIQTDMFEEDPIMKSSCPRAALSLCRSGGKKNTSRQSSQNLNEVCLFMATAKLVVTSVTS